MAGNNEMTNNEDLNIDDRLLQESFVVLAGSDPENCSYSKGYVKRQAVFVCRTCTPNPEEPAGVCLGCANHCHSDHDVIDLYTKRNFRCDCGNKKFADFTCQLTSPKEPQNAKNLYNHNFKNYYCSCDQPCMEAADEDDDEMIQCVICEDWFHSGHLGCAVAEPEELQEMICEACMNKAPFLWTYAAHFAVPPVLSVSAEEGEQEEASESQTSSSGKEESTQEETEPKSSARKRKREEMEGSGSSSSSSHSSEAVVCKLKDLERLERLERQRIREGAVFWPCEWRSELCTCTDCKRAYVSAQVQFLLDPADSLLDYERRGLQAELRKHLVLSLSESLSESASHVQQLELIYGIQEISTALSNYIEQCQENNQPLTRDNMMECLTEFIETYRKKRRDNGYNTED